MANDTEDCARYLTTVRPDGSWTRFDAAVEDFLKRDPANAPDRRRSLADAYIFVAPKDEDGFLRILDNA